METKIKVFIMTIVSLVATMVSESGLPETGNQWIVFGVTIVGVVLTYVAINFLKPSVSKPGTLDWIDILKGLFLAVGTAIADFVANLATGDPLDLTELAKLVGVVVLGYFSKTFFQKPIENEKTS